ncbi:MAG: sugar transporter substrate-binding protein [Thermomicrobiales bacterium]|nr:sugar transporter substrate-binding protein [Thermomicrobiales bacterium]
MSKRFNRRRFSVLAAGVIAVPVVGVTPRLVTAQDATPGATPSAASGAESLAQMEGRVFSTGPQGESPTAASEVVLSEEELAEIQGMGATAAIVMHYSGDDWSAAQIAGLRDQFGKMGIEVIAEDRLHGQRPAGVHTRRGLRQRRLGG